MPVVARRGPEIQQPRFLQAYADCGCIIQACRQAKVPRSSVYDWRKTDPEFVERMKEAREQAVDALEGAAMLRAKRRSDTLLIFMLKTLRREVYGPRTETPITRVPSVDVTVNVATQVNTAGLTDDEIVLMRRLLEKLAVDLKELPPAVIEAQTT